ncbi:transposase [Microbaculum marinisediminis]|uniref:Transposase n=1 Tax=Microbaculum marinisediminis TaxID=2931392 RepID=A0AAW5R7N8_9HYPH|nr:transposase [Microbaculum sp. A6E488]MCT8974659.1 transposase [Microbaculum sp. A6E488]
MEIDLAALPDDIEVLHHLIGDLVAALDHKRAEARAEIDRLRHIVKLLQRNRFGRRSERLDDDQMLLGLEDVDADIARAEAACPASSP